MAALDAAFRAWIKPDLEESMSERFCTLIFAGTADINERNVDQLLGHWFKELENDWEPEPLVFDPPVIQESISSLTHPGLPKVLSWLTTDTQFGDEIEALERPHSLLDYITTLEPGPDQYLVVLWGDGSDEETEKLADQALRLGITVLDLTDGLEQIIELRAQPPEEKVQEPVQLASRRRRSVSEAAPVEEDILPEETVEGLPISDLPELVKDYLRRMLTAALKELENIGEPVRPTAGPPSLAAKTDAPAGSSDHPKQAAPGVEYPADADVEPPSGTKKYLIDPDTKEYKRLRGRPRTDRKDWKFIYLTPEQEQDFGLVLAF